MFGICRFFLHPQLGLKKITVSKVSWNKCSNHQYRYYFPSSISISKIQHLDDLSMFEYPSSTKVSVWIINIHLQKIRQYRTRSISTDLNYPYFGVWFFFTNLPGRFLKSGVASVRCPARTLGTCTSRLVRRPKWHLRVFSGDFMDSQKSRWKIQVETRKVI